MDNVVRFPVIPRETAFTQGRAHLPISVVVDQTMSTDPEVKAAAIRDFYARLGNSEIGWDDLTMAQQRRWQELVGRAV